jgi:hypothetical protein
LSWGTKTSWYKVIKNRNVILVITDKRLRCFDCSKDCPQSIGMDIIRMLVEDDQVEILDVEREEDRNCLN